MAATHSLDLEKSSSQYASIADASCPNLEISGSKTWECWIKIESLPGWQYMISKFHDGTQTGVRLGINGSTNVARFQNKGLTTNEVVESTFALTIGVWIHIAAVYDSSATKLRMYINGELNNEVTASGSSTDSNTNFDIGSNAGNNRIETFDGLIRNVRVWNVARTQQEIRDNMNVDIPVGTGLQGNWILNNAYTDSSANGYTLTASGSPTFSTTYPDAIDLVENKTFTKNHKITVQHTQVAGSSNLTDVPIVFTESNFLSDIFTNSQGSEINTNKLKTDSSLKAYYRMESGALTTDSSGNGYTLTNNNTVGEATGKFIGAASGGTSNTNKYLSIASDLGINGDSAITMSAWIKLSTEIAAGQYGILVHGSTTTAARRLQLYYEYNAGTRRLVLENAGTTGTYTIALGTSDWYHIVVTRASGASGTANLYINGIKVISGTAKGTTSPSTAKFFMFADNSATIFLSGLIDDVSVFDRALSDEEVRSLYAGGQDLRFSSDIDGKTRLAHEIVSFDKGTSKAEVWVKANTLDYDDNTDIYVHYGNSTASALDENEAFGKHQVYNSNFTGVWHLQSSSTDSTQNNNDGTDTAITYNSTNGKIKNGAGLNGSSSFINIGNKSLFTSNLTILMWVNPNATQSSSYTTILSKHSNGGYAIEQDNLNVNSYYFGWDTTGAGAYTGSAIKTQLTADTWQHFAITKSGVTATHYVNASQSATGNGSSATISTNSVNLNIGRWTSGTARYFNGELDTLMILNTNLSADYISTIYNNQNSPSTFAIPSSLAGGSFLFNFV